MRSSFLDYAMSVIVVACAAGRPRRPEARSSPRFSARCTRPGSSRAGRVVKCARVVGDVMGTYHPHGDVAIYDTLVRMAQPFSLRYPLVDGQGNFGNIDDDPPAADAVHGVPAHASSRRRCSATSTPTPSTSARTTTSRAASRSVLPSRFPNLPRQRLAGHRSRNGDEHPAAQPRRGDRRASSRSIDKPEMRASTDLMKHVKGPDFPTGGIIVGRSGIRDAYRTGRGRIVMRARAHVEELRGGKTRDHRDASCPTA